MIDFRDIAPDGQALRAIAALYCTCFNAPDKGENWTEESALAYFRERIAEESIFGVAEDEGGALMGVCCGGPYERSFIARDLGLECGRHFYISLVAVDASVRGRGLGHAMVKALGGRAAAEGYEGVIVRCRAENAPMLKVLSRAGFEEISRYTAELGGVTCERVVLRKGCNQ